MGGDLRTALARRIRIIAQERLILAVAPRPLLILIDLIRRHHERRTNGVRCADTFKDIDGPHHICRKRLHGLTVARPHNRLRREVKDDLRPRRSKRASECIGIAHIAAQIAQLLQNAKPTERLPSALRRRIECKARHLCPRPEEQEGKPHALKARMSREEDVSAFEKPQIFHISHLVTVIPCHYNKVPHKKHLPQKFGSMSIVMDYIRHAPIAHPPPPPPQRPQIHAQESQVDGSSEVHVGMCADRRFHRCTPIHFVSPIITERENPHRKYFRHH